MTEYLQIITDNFWNNRLYYSIGIIVLLVFFVKWLSKKIFNQDQRIKLSDSPSKLEQNVKDWAFYRYILQFFINPISNEDLLNTEIGAISDLSDILNYLEKWGGLNFSNGLWLITEKGKKILEKYNSIN